MKKRLIKGGTIVDPANNIHAAMDLLVEGETISAIGAAADFKGITDCETVDATGKLVVPGFVDVHVHLREPGAEWKETIATGCQAAVLGGYTTVCAMPNTKPVNDSAEVTRFILEKAKAANLCRVLPIGAVTVDLHGEKMAPYYELREAGCVAFSDDGEPIFNAGLMRRTLELAKSLGATVSCHEEDKTLSCCGAMNESPTSLRLGYKGWAKVAEEVMIARDIELARVTGARVHFCHVSTKRGIILIRRAKEDGIPVSCEVTPHHLTLTECAVEKHGTMAKMSPPLREEEDVAALIEGLLDGTVDCIATDHAPHDRDLKEVEFGRAAFGILGLQTAFPLINSLVQDKGLPIKRAIELLSTSPARVFGLPGNGLRRGAAADITIVDPGASFTLSKAMIASKSFNTPYLEQQLPGRVSAVLCNGRLVVDQGNLIRGEK